MRCRLQKHTSVASDWKDLMLQMETLLLHVSSLACKGKALLLVTSQDQMPFGSSLASLNRTSVPDKTLQLQKLLHQATSASQALIRTALLQVLLQRAMLLAKCLANTTSAATWQEKYVKLMMSAQGEYIQTKEGSQLLKDKVSKSSPVAPATWASAQKQLRVDNTVEF